MEISSAVKRFASGVMRELTEAGRYVKAFAKTNIPLTVSEYLKWGFVEALVTGILELMGAIALIGVIAWWIASGYSMCSAWELNILKLAHSDGSTCHALTGVITWLLLPFAACAACGIGRGGYRDIMAALQIKIAPRVWLIEEIKRIKDND